MSRTKGGDEGGDVGWMEASGRSLVLIIYARVGALGGRLCINTATSLVPFSGPEQ